MFLLELEETPFQAYRLFAHIENLLTAAIQQICNKGFLQEYLTRKSTEVQNMLLMEYDYDTDIEVQRKEAFDDGIIRGFIKQKSKLLKSS